MSVMKDARPRASKRLHGRLLCGLLIQGKGLTECYRRIGKRPDVRSTHQEIEDEVDHVHGTQGNDRDAQHQQGSVFDIVIAVGVRNMWLMGNMPGVEEMQFHVSLLIFRFYPFSIENASDKAIRFYEAACEKSRACKTLPMRRLQVFSMPSRMLPYGSSMMKRHDPSACFLTTSSE